jgi:hypothetical protein
LTVTGLPLTEIDYFLTSCISTGPMVMANRGVLELISREQRPDGRYHLKYGNPFNGMTYNGAVRKWLEGVKHAEGKKAKMRVSEAA